jgi:hypothetical protein
VICSPTYELPLESTAMATVAIPAVSTIVDTTPAGVTRCRALRRT